MKTLASLLNQFTNLSNNGSSANQSTGLDLLDERHRLLMENYFDNETQFSTPTIGAMTLTLTSEPTAGATSATLSTAWTYASGQQQVTFTNAVTMPTLATNPASGATSATLASAWIYATQSILTTFSDGEVRTVLYTNNSTAISWTTGLTSAVSTSLTLTLPQADIPVVTFTNGSTAISWQQPLQSYVTSTSISTAGFQRYRIPANLSKITNSTMTVGQMRFVPAPAQTRTEWDNINFLPYNSNIPNYFFIYGGYVEFWPIPSVTGDVITFNYKSRVPDFSTSFLFSNTSGAQYIAGQTVYDYQQGTIATASEDGYTVTGTGTAWVTAQGPTGGLGMGVGQDATQYNLYLVIYPPAGDGLWYPIQSFGSNTTLTLTSPIMNATNISGSTYAIGQLPTLQEDFQPMLVYGALAQYYTNIVPDPNKFKQNDAEYKMRLGMLEDYAGTKQVNYNLGDRPALLNPNRYPYYPNNVNS